MLSSAQYWSPFTRDLALDDNDQPRRRTVYLCIGTCVLFCMAYITAFPLLRVNHFYATTLLGRGLAYGLVATGVCAVLATIVRTRRYLLNPNCVEFRFFIWVSAITLPSIVYAWTDGVTARPDVCRPLFQLPLSGVCPLIPVLLLLMAWFLWAICQVSRLGFSEMRRPRMPLLVRIQHPYVTANTPYPLYVPEEALQACSRTVGSCLYENITTLLITREVLNRFCVNVQKAATGGFRELIKQLQERINLVLCLVYSLLFLAIIFASNVRSLERFVSTPILQLNTVG